MNDRLSSAAPTALHCQAWRRAIHEYRREIKRRRDLTPATKLIIDEVLDHFGVNDHANPSLRRLQELTGTRSFSTVQRAVEIAEREAILVVERTGRRPVFRLPGAVSGALKNRAQAILTERSEKQSARDNGALRSARESAPKDKKACSDSCEPRAPILDSDRSEDRSLTYLNQQQEPEKNLDEPAGNGDGAILAAAEGEAIIADPDRAQKIEDRRSAILAAAEQERADKGAQPAEMEPEPDPGDLTAQGHAAQRLLRSIGIGDMDAADLAAHYPLCRIERAVEIARERKNYNPGGAVRDLLQKGVA